jgi:hypothetical protein
LSPLIGDPDLLFLDEPTTGFDPGARRQACSTIRSLCDLGKTLFLTTHYMDEAQHLANRVAVMSSGEIIAIRRPDELGGRDLRPAEIRFSLADAWSLGESGRDALKTRGVLSSSRPVEGAPRDEFCAGGRPVCSGVTAREMPPLRPMRLRGLEPPRPEEHRHLKPARLPIPPQPRGRQEVSRVGPRQHCASGCSARASRAR